MLGIEINFLNVKPNCDDVICEVIGPFFDDDSDRPNKSDLETWLNEGNKLEICINEYLGNQDDYNFNDCRAKHVIKNVNALNNFNNDIYKIF